MTVSAPCWRTATKSHDSGNCVEVADNLPGVVLVRDSKDRSGPVLSFTPGAWRSLIAGLGISKPPAGFSGGA